MAELPTRRTRQSATDVERLRWTYRELLRIESSRTAEVQNQQQRAATVLAANGFLLALLANHALASPTLSWEVGVELASVIFLASAVLSGLGALWPRIRVRGEQSHESVEDAERAGLFLYSGYFMRSLSTASETDTLSTLCSALDRNIAQNKYYERINTRRRFLQAQFLLIAIGVVLLVVATGLALAN